MNFFIGDVWAEGAAPAGDGGLMGLLPLLLIFVIFYFLLLRPQMKRSKEHRTMVVALAKGDEVVTSGGVLGKITSVDESFVGLDIANGLEIKVQRSAVSSLMPKGTMKGKA
ncbi:MAG: preprotein translocase subunit YajC [Thiotrichaceae bacterium]|nr:preprotein translocase subunit YajC [Thiotrichaceae bacterium]PCI11940.1 MAG: preprotein translocase subunit YajC [Thiotrichales bacterium]